MADIPGSNRGHFWVPPGKAPKFRDPTQSQNARTISATLGYALPGMLLQLHSMAGKPENAALMRKMIRNMLADTCKVAPAELEGWMRQTRKDEMTDDDTD